MNNIVLPIWLFIIIAILAAFAVVVIGIMCAIRIIIWSYELKPLKQIDDEAYDYDKKEK